MPQHLLVFLVGSVVVTVVPRIKAALERATGAVLIALGLRVAVAQR